MTTKEQEIQQVINEFTMEFCIDMPHPDERLGEIHTVMERSPNEYKDFIKASLERLYAVGYEKGYEEGFDEGRMQGHTEGRLEVGEDIL